MNDYTKLASADDEARQKLIRQLVLLYLLSASDIKTMSNLIATARIDSMKASYDQTSKSVGADGQDWQPSNDIRKQIQEASEKDAETIAQTYKENLENAVTAFVHNWQMDHDTLDGAEPELRTEIATWVKDRTEWKSEQIANLTCGSGANDGIDAWIEDLQNGAFDAINTDNVEIAVLPLTSSNDVCSTYAGLTFSVEEADDLPSFPIHPNCEHRRVVSLK